MTPAPISSKASPNPLTAVLLAGGESRRMGRDKALVEFDGVPMWQRQLAILEALKPGEIFVSGARRTEFPATLRTVEDAGPGRGPLAGLASALRAAAFRPIVVLAIDLPNMSSDFLAQLIGQAGPRCGVVPFLIDLKTQRKFYEPLAAIYPRECRALAEFQLAGTDWSMQTFVRDAIAAGLLREIEIAADARLLFRNVNEPADSLPRAQR